MNRNKKTGVRVRGFMCQSAATASSVCMPIDSAVVPIRRRPPFLLHHNHLCRNAGVSNGYHNDNKRLISERSTNFLPASSSSFIKRQQPQPQDLPVLDPKPKPRPFIQPSLPLASPDQVFQVVVMRVSLHCQGCAGKLKKHLSKMEGVTSFSIDLETKRVTVMGHVSPTAVLESISTVKRAEFWPC